MKLALRIVPLAFALVSGLACAAGSGTLYQEGKETALVSAYAFRGPDP